MTYSFRKIFFYTILWVGIISFCFVPRQAQGKRRLLICIVEIVPWPRWAKGRPTRRTWLSCRTTLRFKLKYISSSYFDLSYFYSIAKTHVISVLTFSLVTAWIEPKKSKKLKSGMSVQSWNQRKILHFEISYLFYPFTVVLIK